MISSEYISWKVKGLWKSNEELQLREKGESSTAPSMVTGDSMVIRDGRSRSSEPTVRHSVREVLRVWVDRVSF